MGDSYLKSKSKTSKGIHKSYNKVSFDIAATSNEEKQNNLEGGLL